MIMLADSRSISVGMGVLTHGARSMALSSPQPQRQFYARDGHAESTLRRVAVDLNDDYRRSWEYR